MILYSNICQRFLIIFMVYLWYYIGFSVKYSVINLRNEIISSYQPPGGWEYGCSEYE